MIELAAIADWSVGCVDCAIFTRMSVLPTIMCV